MTEKANCHDTKSNKFAEYCCVGIPSIGQFHSPAPLTRYALRTLLADQLATTRDLLRSTTPFYPRSPHENARLGSPSAARMTLADILQQWPALASGVGDALGRVRNAS